MKKYLTNNKGSESLFIVAALIIFLMIFSVYYQYHTLKINADMVKNAVENATISVCLDNFDEMYSSDREGYTGAYSKQGSSWKLDVSQGDVYAKLKDNLSLVYDDGKYVKYDGNKICYTLSGLNVNAKASAFRSDTYSETMFNADSTINIRMELSFLGVDCPVTTKVKCKAKYNYRF